MAPPSASEPPATSEKSAATPAVRKLAKELGIDLADRPAPVPAGGSRTKTSERRRRVGVGCRRRGAPITPVRREIARRLTEVAAIPQVTTFRTVDCTALETFRGERERVAAPGLHRGAGRDVSSITRS